ncbi:hypothetical protein ACA910_002721 [Epithemia clementina (nom. ined.)]
MNAIKIQMLICMIVLFLVSFIWLDQQQRTLKITEVCLGHLDKTTGVESPHCAQLSNKLSPRYGHSQPRNGTVTKQGSARGQEQGNTSDKLKQFPSLLDNPLFLKEQTRDDQSYLSSFTYSNCPFTLAKFSQYHMAKTGPFKSAVDKKTNSLMRAEMALELSNDFRAYQRVRVALEKHAFNRTIFMYGDSLTRQLFISLSCLAWSAGYVNEYSIGHVNVESGSANTILRNANYTASSRRYWQGHVKLRGGGAVYYGGPQDVNRQGNILGACNTSEDFEAKDPVDSNKTVKFDQDDVVVAAAGHHTGRQDILSLYKHIFPCILKAKTNKRTSAVARWPHFIYQLPSVPHFWTKDGTFQSPNIPGKDQMSCRESVPVARDSEQDRNTLQGLVPFLADTVDYTKLGEYHVWHGDCLHWLQPGVPDLYAAQLADFVLALEMNVQ